MSLRDLVIIRNPELTPLLQDPTFENKWKTLEEATPGFSILQSSEFVTCWYRHYADTYEPVLVVAFDEEQSLLGLMALAWHKEEARLTHAGHYAAEYHGFLARPEHCREFFLKALTEIKKQFAVKSWEWNFLPPNLPLELGKEEKRYLTKAGVYLVVEEQENPEWDLKDGQKLKKTLKSSSLRSKRNRLKRRGELRFEVIKDPACVERALAIAYQQVDFRKEAQFGVRPFADDTRVLAFNLELLERHACLHACALWLDDQLLAFHLGAEDGKRLHLGMISFDPSEYVHSPGSILLAELAKELTESGYEVFDITPGQDGYKQRYANSYTRIQKPRVYFSKMPFAKRRLTSEVKQQLQRRGYWQRIREMKHKRSEKDHASISGGDKHLFDPKTLILPKTPTQASGQGEKISIQDYAELLKYQDSAPFCNRRALLQAAFEKFKKAEQVYSVASTDTLLAMGWMRKLKKEEYLGGRLLAAGSYVAGDFYFISEQIKSTYFLILIGLMQKKADPETPFYLLLTPEEISFFTGGNLEETSPDGVLA